MGVGGDDTAYKKRNEKVGVCMMGHALETRTIAWTCNYPLRVLREVPCLSYLNSISVHYIIHEQLYYPDPTVVSPVTWHLLLDMGGTGFF